MLFSRRPGHRDQPRPALGLRYEARLIPPRPQDPVYSSSTSPAVGLADLTDTDIHLAAKGAINSLLAKGYLMQEIPTILTRAVQLRLTWFCRG